MLLSDVCLMSIRYMASASSASLVDMYIRHRSLQFHNMVVLGGGHTLGILRFAVSFLQQVKLEKKALFWRENLKRGTAEFGAEQSID